MNRMAKEGRQEKSYISYLPHRTGERWKGRSRERKAGRQTKTHTQNDLG